MASYTTIKVVIFFFVCILILLSLFQKKKKIFDPEHKIKWSTWSHF